MNYVGLIFQKFLPICNTASAKENPLSSKVRKASKDVPAGENKTTSPDFALFWAVMTASDTLST